MKRGPSQCRGPVIGVEHSIAQILKGRAVKLIGAGLCEYVDDAAGRAPILCIVTVGLDAKFLNGIGVGQDVAGVEQAGHVVAAIQVVVYSAGAAIDTAVNQGALLRKPEN